MIILYTGIDEAGSLRFQRQIMVYNKRITSQAIPATKQRVTNVKKDM